MRVISFVPMGEPRPVQASHPGPALKPTGVPEEVGAGGDVVEGGLAFGGVDGGLDEAGGLAILRVGDGDEAGPEWSDGTGAADDHVLAVDADDVAGGGIGVAGDVGERRGRQ